MDRAQERRVKERRSKELRYEKEISEIHDHIKILNDGLKRRMKQAQDDLIDWGFGCMRNNGNGFLR